MPRKWIQKLYESAAAKVDRAKERGGDPGKLQRAESRRQQYDAWLKQTGRADDTSSLFKIKGEKEKLAKAEKAIVRVQSLVTQAEEEIQKLQDKIVDLRAQEKRHCERRDDFKRKITYLSAQVHIETLPESKEQEIQAAKAKMEQSGEPAYQVIIDMLSVMVPPSRDADVFDMAADDTSSDTTVIDMGDPGDDGNPAGDGHGAALMADQALLHIDVERAQHCLNMHLLARARAVDNAKAAERKKRHRDDAGEEPQDSDEDVHMALTITQVEAIYEQRIIDAREQVQRLESMLDEKIPVLSPPCQPHPPQVQNGGPNQGAAAASSGHNGGLCPLAPLQPTTGADTPPPPRAMGGRAIAARLEASTVTAEMADARAAAADIERDLILAQRAEAQIAQQEEEQAILDAEVAAMRRAVHGVPVQLSGAVATPTAAPAAEVPAPSAAVYGPTGASLVEQQMSMRRATAQETPAPQPAAPRASCRWERANRDIADGQEQDNERGRGQRSKSPRGRQRSAPPTNEMRD